MAGGTFEAGGGTLLGAGVMAGTGTFNWTGGTICAALNLAPAVSFNLSGGSDKTLGYTPAPGQILSAGPGTWSGAGNLIAESGGQWTNNGAFTVQNDALGTNGTQQSQGTPQPSQTAVDPNLVVDQILRGAFLNTVGTVSTVRLRLVPEELGDVSVKLTLEGSTVSAQVMAQTPAAQRYCTRSRSRFPRAAAWPLSAPPVRANRRSSI